MYKLPKELREISQSDLLSRLAFSLAFRLGAANAGAREAVEELTQVLCKEFLLKKVFAEQEGTSKPNNETPKPNNG